MAASIRESAAVAVRRIAGDVIGLGSLPVESQPMPLRCQHPPFHRHRLVIEHLGPVIGICTLAGQTTRRRRCPFAAR